jgi:DNA helicase-2/ATP-dependent DNA helicase PcrA
VSDTNDSFDLDLPALSEISIPGIDKHPPDTSVRLHGPPGTGKTTTAAARVARLVDEYEYGVGDIVWTTYRRSLAEDTLERLAYWNVIAPEQLSDPTEGATRFISTNHAVARRAVGGLPDPVKPWHRQQFCRDLGIKFQGGPPWEKQAGELLFRTFNWLNTNLYDPANPAEVANADPPTIEDLNKQWNGDIPRAWNRWEDFKAQYDLIDFHEMISAVIENDVPLPGKVFVIDEYHDAYPLLAQLCEHWMVDAEVVICAGDPHQVVNSFDGADPWFFESLPYPKVLLDTTYRVPEEHWQLASSVLGTSNRHTAPDVERLGHGEIYHHDAGTTAFEHVGATASTADVGGWKVPTPEHGPAAIIDNHARGAGEPDGAGIGPDPASVLVLARTQRQVDGISAALERAGMLYISQRDMRGWNSQRSKTRLYLFNALQQLRTFDASSHASEREQQSLQTLGSGSWDNATTDSLSLMPRQAAALLEHTKSKSHRQGRSKTSDLIEEIRNNQHGRRISDEQLADWVVPAFWERYSAGAASVSRLVKGSLSGRDLTALERALDRHEESGTIEVGDIGVAVMTVHASKGQEADDVIVYDGITNTIKDGMRGDADTDANEWRTWYVACSRASERLHLVHGGFNWTVPLPVDVLNERHSGRVTPSKAATDGGR